MAKWWHTLHFASGHLGSIARYPLLLLTTSGSEGKPAAGAGGAEVYLGEEEASGRQKRAGSWLQWL